jgi:type I restriction enzyme S subunit
VIEMPLIRLAEVADIESGAGFPLHHQGKGEEQFPFLKVSDMNLPGNERCINRWNHSVSEVTRVEIRARVFSPGTVIFPKIGAAIATNKKRLLNIPSCVDNNVMGATPKPHSLVSEYLYHLFCATDLSLFASASNPPSIRKSEVENWLVRIPTLNEQRRIVGLLDQASEIRRRADAAHAKARATIHALFADIFGHPATLLERYPVAEMEQIISDKQLGLVRSSREQPEDGAFGYVRMNSITTDGRVVLDDLRRTNASDREAKTNELRDGDLLFNTRNSLELVGKMGIYRGPSGNLFNNNIMRIRLSGVMCAEYLNAYFQCTEGRAAIDAIKKGTTSVCAVYYKDLARVRLPVPPVVLQSAFAEQTQRLETIARHLDGAAAKAEAMAAGLSAEVFGASSSKGNGHG